MKARFSIIVLLVGAVVLLGAQAATAVTAKPSGRPPHGLRCAYNWSTVRRQLTGRGYEGLRRSTFSGSKWTVAKCSANSLATSSPRLETPTFSKIALT